LGKHSSEAIITFVTTTKKEANLWIKALKQIIIEPLFNKIGGAPAIQAVVDGMYEKIFSDQKLE